MRLPRKTFGFAAALLCALTLVTGQEQQQQQFNPSLTIVRVGSADVSNGEHVVLQQAITDVFGHASNYQDKEFYALVRFREGRQWYVAAANKSEPGGVFNVGGIRFPQAGDFELLVTVREQSSLAVGKWIDESQWRDQSLAVSNRISITVEGSPIVEGDSGDGEFHISLLSIANVGLRAREINVVPASGDVVLRARGLPNSKFYLAVHIPYTDRCHIIGPAKPSVLPNTYLIESVSFEAAGDPQQVHFDLLAFASTRAVHTGPMSWQAFRSAETVTSPTTQIIIEGRRPRVDGLRVPFISVTRIGRHALGTAEPDNRRLDVNHGDILEIEQYERTTEGALMWALTRTRGSTVWLAQGPLLPRGLPSTAAEEGRPVVTWVLPSLQFQPESEEELEEPEFEVMAALSNAMFPNSWISSSSISAQNIETISKPVLVRVEGHITRSKQQLSITQIGNQQADGENEMTVGTIESVVITRPETFAEPYKVYLGKHVAGAETWSFVEAIPNGKTHFVPAVHFSNPHPLEGARYQVLAIATKGPLPAREVEYHDFIPHVVMSSELVNVRYSSGSLSVFASSLQSWFSIFTWEGITTMLLIFLLTTLTLILMLAGLMWLFRSNPALAGEVADTLQRGHASVKKKFELPESINLPHMLLGIVLLVVIVYVIRNYYISLYTHVVETSTGLAHKASADLALWIILVTALAGIFADIAHKQNKATLTETGGQQAALTGIHQYIFYGSIMIAAVLWLFQGLIYSTFLGSSKGDTFMQTAGFGAGFLISITETIAFFIITELTLIPAGWFILGIFLAPLTVGAFVFRFIERVFTHKPPEQRGAKPPPPEPANTGEPENSNESPPPKDEVES